MKIIGLSSATEVISFGLIDDDRVLAEATIAQTRAETIMPLLAQAGVEPAQIEAIAVASGPGSYSGLRGGLATAKSLAQTLQVPLIGISTLEAIAYNLVEVEGTMAVILDARLDEYNFALFGASGGKLKRLTDDLVIKLDKLNGLLQKIEGPLYLIGKLEGVRGKGVGSRENLRFADEIHSKPYGINVAKLGLLKIKAGKKSDPLELVPSYSHQPHFKEFNP